MSPVEQHAVDICRRTFLGRGMAGFGALALRSLLPPALTAAAGAADTPWRGVVNPLHHAAKAKRVIFLYQAGGPSHLETFDYKPKLAAMHGEPMPESFTKGQQLAQLQRQKLMCFAPQFALQDASASPVRRWPKSSRTSAASPTSSASSARCTESRSITIPPTRS